MNPNLRLSAMNTLMSDHRPGGANDDDTIDVLQPSPVLHAPDPIPALPLYPDSCFLRLEFLGRGGNGKVFKAFNKRANRLVALKRIPLFTSDGRLAGRTRLRTELAVIDRLASAKPGRFLEYFGVFRDQFFLYLEMQPGTTSLGELLAAGRSFSRREVVFILRELLAGLLELREKGVLHRDVKPANVLLVATGHPREFEFKLYDFGAGYVMNEAERRRGRVHRDSILGFTPEFTAPEIVGNFDQATEDYDAFAADLYSLGVTMLKLLGGRELLAQGLGPFLTRFGRVGSLVASLLVPEPERRADAQTLGRWIEAAIFELDVRPPLIEKSMVLRAIRGRLMRELGNDRLELMSHCIQFLRKYLAVGLLRELEGFLELAFTELLAEGAGLRFSYHEVKLLEVAGWLLLRRGRLAAAEQAFSEAYKVAKTLHWGPTNGITAESATAFGRYCLQTARLPAAESLLRQAFALNQETFGPGHLLTVASMRDLGELCLGKGQFGKALEVLSEAMRRVETLAGCEEAELIEGHWNLLGVEEMVWLRWLRITKGEEEGEIPARGSEEEERRKMEFALEMRARAAGKLLARRKGETALLLAGMGEAALGNGELRKARLLLIRGLRMAVEVFGELSWEAARLGFWLGRTLRMEGEIAKAERAGLRALEIRNRTAPHSVETLESLVEMAALYARAGDTAKLLRFSAKIVERQKVAGFAKDKEALPAVDI